MAFLTTRPEALMAAAGVLEGVGTAMVAHNVAAAAPITGVVPAAADQVSALQATQFAAYGTLYQQISNQASVIHQMIVNTLASSADSYGGTEMLNATGNGPPGSGLSLIGLLTGQTGGPFGLLGSTLSNSAVIGAMQAGNFGSAASDFSELGAAGFLTGDGSEQPPDSAGTDRPVLVAAPGTTGVAAAPVTAGLGQASSAGRLSVPAGWASSASATPDPAGTLAEPNTASAAVEETPVTGIPAGLPGAAAEHDGLGAGPSKYAVKPNLTPLPPGV